MIIHTDLFVHSIERSLEFYVDGLGFKIVDDFMVNGDLVRFVSDNRYACYRVVLLQVCYGSAMIELIEYIGDKKCDDINTLLSNSTIVVLVPSLDKKIDELRKKGIYPVSDIFTVCTKKVGKSNIIFYKDPDGNCVEFLEMVREDNNQITGDKAVQ